MRMPTAKNPSPWIATGDLPAVRTHLSRAVQSA